MLVKGTEGVIAYFPGCNLGCLVSTEHVCSCLPKQLQVYRHSLENGHKKMYKNLNYGIKKGNNLNVHQWNGRMEDYTHVPDRKLYSSTRLCVLSTWANWEDILLSKTYNYLQNNLDNGL